MLEAVRIHFRATRYRQLCRHQAAKLNVRKPPGRITEPLQVNYAHPIGHAQKQVARRLRAKSFEAAGREAAATRACEH